MSLPILICKLLDAILYPLKVGTGTDAIFISIVPSPLDDERHDIVVTFFPQDIAIFKID